jgi:cytochrome c556
MKRSVLVLALTFAGSALILVRAGGSSSGSGGAVSAQEKGPGIAEFMLVVHDKQGILPQVRQALTGAGPADDKAWKAVHARAAVIATLGEAILSKKLPDKGDKASWREKVGSYLASAKALEAAAASKNAEKARTEAGKLQKSCNACHKAHQ